VKNLRGPWRAILFHFSHNSTVFSEQKKNGSLEGLSFSIISFLTCDEKLVCPLKRPFTTDVTHWPRSGSFLYPLYSGLSTFLIKCSYNQINSWTYLQPWRRRQHVSLKRRYPPTRLQCHDPEHHNLNNLRHRNP
jgi:hypothetical protein